VKGDDRLPTALRARPPRGARRPRALVLRDPVVGRVVVAMRDSGDELGPEPAPKRGPACCLAGMATVSARTARCVSRGWLKEGDCEQAGSGLLALETMADVGAGPRG
jgi:hypothetical protein